MKQKSKTLSLLGMLLLVTALTCNGCVFTPRKSEIIEVDTDGWNESWDDDAGNASYPVVEFYARDDVPDDIWEEVKYYVGGAGPSPCDPVSSPRIVEEEICRNHELNDWISVSSCGWRDGESVHISLHTPDNTVIEWDDEVKGETFPFVAGFPTSLSDTPGVYTFTIEGESGTVQETLHVLRPVEPRLYMQEGGLLLYNFQPDEFIRLFAYYLDSYGTASLTGWQEYQVGHDGQLFVKVGDDTSGVWIVVGSESGVVCEYSGCGSEWCLLSNIINMGAVEANTGTDRLNVRSGPGYEYDVIAQVASGTVMRVIGDPRNVAGDKWWPVQLDDGTEGWVIDSWVIYHSNSNH